MSSLRKGESSFNVTISNVQLTNHSFPTTACFVAVEFPSAKKEKTHSMTLAPVTRFPGRFSFEYRLRPAEALARQKLRMTLTAASSGMFSRDKPIDAVEVDLYTIATGPVAHSLPLRTSDGRAGTLSFDVAMEQVTCAEVDVQDVQVAFTAKPPSATTLRGMAVEFELCDSNRRPIDGAKKARTKGSQGPGRWREAAGLEGLLSFRQAVNAHLSVTVITPGGLLRSAVSHAGGSTQLGTAIAGRRDGHSTRLRVQLHGRHGEAAMLTCRVVSKRGPSYAQMPQGRHTERGIEGAVLAAPHISARPSCPIQLVSTGGPACHDQHRPMPAPTPTGPRGGYPGAPGPYPTPTAGGPAPYPGGRGPYPPTPSSGPYPGAGGPTPAPGPYPAARGPPSGPPAYGSGSVPPPFPVPTPPSTGSFSFGPGGAPPPSYRPPGGGGGAVAVPPPPAAGGASVVSVMPTGAATGTALVGVAFNATASYPGAQRQADAAAQAGDGPDLPEPWTARQDASGRYKFINRRTGLAVYTLPTLRTYKCHFVRDGKLGLTFREQQNYAVVSAIDAHGQAAGVDVPDEYIMELADLEVGHRLIGINGSDMRSRPVHEVLEQLRDATRPMELEFENLDAVPEELAARYSASLRRRLSRERMRAPAPAPAPAPAAPPAAAPGPDLSGVPASLRHIYTGPFSDSPEAHGWAKEPAGEGAFIYIHTATSTYSRTWPPTPWT